MGISNNRILFMALLTFTSQNLRISETTCSQGFQIKKEHLNKRLIAYSFLKITVAGHHDCARECFNFGGECKAINFNKKNKKCELKYKGSDSVDVSEFEVDGGYIFSDITEWPKSMMGGCAAHNCQDHQFCLPHGNSDFQCVDKANCGPAPAVDYGTVSAPITTDGATATYSCNFGYEFVDDVITRRCDEGIWTEEAIVCTLKDCGPLSDITYGTVSAPITTHEASATYSCQYGYRLTSGDSTRTCVDGTWGGVQPTCTIKDCGPLSDITYGIVSAPITTHAASATFSCQYGYGLTSGDSTRTCVDGTWSGVKPTCTIKDCGLLADVTYGTVSAPVTTHEASATYSCQYGYGFTSGDSTRTCVDGIWSGIQPTCTIKDCGYLPGIPHGTVHTPVTTHGATAVYECYSDYEISSGYSTRTCDDGSWTGSEAVCTPIPNVGCYTAGYPYLYKGTSTYTQGGIYCQRWDAQNPHDHGNTNPDLFPEDTLTNSENYCRDPDGEGAPWCYTTNIDVRWDFCGVQLC